MERLVPGLAHSELLMTNGWKLPTAFVWRYVEAADAEMEWLVALSVGDMDWDKHHLPAPMAQELIDPMPATIPYERTRASLEVSKDAHGKYVVEYVYYKDNEPQTVNRVVNACLVDAAALMWLWLKSRGHV